MRLDQVGVIEVTVQLGCTTNVDSELRWQISEILFVKRIAMALVHLSALQLGVGLVAGAFDDEWVANLEQGFAGDFQGLSVGSEKGLDVTL